MRRFSELTGRGQLIEVLRWLCVLPAAAIGDAGVRFIVGALVAIARYGGWGDFGDSSVAYALSVFLFYVPRKAAFVVTGTMMAPRCRRAASIVLTALGFFGSLMIHVIGQHIAGNRVGLVNYTHLLAESAGLLGGAAFLYVRDRRRQRADSAA